MRAKGFTILAFIVLTLVLLVTIVRTLPPSPLPVNAPASEFSAERAIQHIRIIAQQPHPTGSPANVTVRDYILQVLQNLGLETATQMSGPLENILGRIPGTRSSDAILLTAHLDSVSQSPGATDDGSGVAVLLETARALKSGAHLANTIIFLFTDDEEAGSVGAKAFINSHPWVKDVKLVIGFDAGGLSGPGVLSATSSRNGWLIRQLAQADSSVVGGSAINALASSSTDFTHAFKVAGFSGFAFDLYWDRRIHSADDNFTNINLSSIQHQGSHALSLARHFGNLQQLADPKETDAIYFNILRLLNVNYSSIWAILLAIAVAVGFLYVLGLGLRRRIFTWSGIGYGTFVLVVGLIIAILPGILLGKLIPTSSQAGRSLNKPLPVSLIVLFILVLIILWYYFFPRMRRISPIDLVIGGLLPLVAALIVTSVLLPTVSYLVAWPLLFNILAIGNWYYWFQRPKNSGMVILGLLFSSVVSIIIILPTFVLGLFDKMSLTLILLSVLSGFLIPQILLILSFTRRNIEP